MKRSKLSIILSLSLIILFISPFIFTSDKVKAIPLKSEIQIILSHSTRLELTEEEISQIKELWVEYEETYRNLKESLKSGEITQEEYKILIRYAKKELKDGVYAILDNSQKRLVKRYIKYENKQFLSPKYKRKLELTDDQITAINALYAQYSQDKKDLRSQYTDENGEITDKEAYLAELKILKETLYSDLIAVLSDEQLEKYNNMIRRIKHNLKYDSYTILINKLMLSQEEIRQLRELFNTYKSNIKELKRQLKENIIDILTYKTSLSIEVDAFIASLSTVLSEEEILIYQKVIRFVKKRGANILNILERKLQLTAEQMEQLKQVIADYQNSYSELLLTLETLEEDARIEAINNFWEGFSSDVLEIFDEEQKAKFENIDQRWIKLYRKVAKGKFSGVLPKEADMFGPITYSLSQNYPNPFNPETTINYTIPEATLVTIKIYNMLGEEVKTLVNEMHSMGTYSARWDGTNNNGAKVAGGIYIYRINAGSFSDARTMVFLK